MSKADCIIITGLTVINEQNVHEQSYVKCKDGKINEIGKTENLQVDDECRVYKFGPEHVLIPGMIDVHIHGANGADTMDATIEALDTMAEALPREGTTSFLATTMTQDQGKIEQALSNVAAYQKSEKKDGTAEILGVHLEGPFISKEKAGAQPLDHIIAPNVTLFNKFQERADGLIKLVTLAPEEDESLTLTKHLRKTGVVASIGHSNATYDDVDKAIAAGATHVTHLYNGMTGLHHREPGVVGAALLRDELFAELIVDGVHSRPEIVKLTLQQKGKDRLILITDAMRAKCLKNGIYDLGGQEVHVKDGKAELPNGHLAGSVLRMADALKNIIDFSHTDIQDAVDMASTNPAKQLNVFDRKGSISVGKDADLVVLDANKHVVMTLCKGILAFQNKEDVAK